MPDPGVREAMVVQYTFFALALEAPNGEAVPTAEARLLEQVGLAVRHLREWLGVRVSDDDSPESLNRPKNPRVLDWPIHKTGLLEDENSRRIGYVRARGHSDTLILQLVLGRHGPGGEDTWDELRAALWSPLEGDPSHLGQTVCLGGIVSREDATTQLATSALAPDRPGQLRQCTLPCGLLMEHSAVPERLVLFYADQVEEKRAENFLHYVLPLLSLYAHKVAREYWDYANNLWPRLDNSGRTLARALSSAAQPESDLVKLEGQLKQVAAAYATFSRELNLFEDRRQSVGINVRNFDEILARNDLPLAGPLSARKAALHRWLARMDVDEGYYRATVRRAEMTLHGLQVQAEVGRAQATEAEAREESRRNLWLAMVGVALAVGQIVDQDAADWVADWSGITLGLTLTRTVAILIAMLLVLGGRWILGRRKGVS
jgi:hypothetical protein